ncbi:hypothetical protein C8F04DRAFT_1061008 [Mycena alexandri]|uniref:Uncharacterized protein n=1 Tax=Mycena alexandri TaxID=1745969 RepID=A0AAD6THY3_9AGAR|nr:hypothetical protein C8F04DRAFT_1061008 [Mycena alexandri]
MGSSSSKATRSLPKRVTTPPWSGARAPRSVDPLKEAASKIKNDVIDQDSKDPQFLSKLNQLGPVRVDHHMQTIRTAELAKQMFNSRSQSENEAAAQNPTQNRIRAPQLSRLLDERKSIRTRREMEFLAARYGLDLEKIDAIAEFLSTPSVHENSALQIGKDGEERTLLRAVWMEPQLRSSAP